MVPSLRFPHSCWLDRARITYAHGSGGRYSDSVDRAADLRAGIGLSWFVISRSVHVPDLGDMTGGLA